jgi:hypothetical protein
LNEAPNTFASELPDRVGEALVEVPKDEMPPAQAAPPALDSASLRCYQDIQLLKVELEIEAATLLRQIGEVVSALTEAAAELTPATAGADASPQGATRDKGSESRSSSLASESSPPAPASRITSSAG